jgi:peroxiredoxin family protein
MSNGLFILLCSGEHEKIQMAGMMASVAAVSERPVEVFVSMNALLAFANGLQPGERYHGDEFSKILCNAPDAISLFQRGKEFGDLKMWACSMSLDVKGWEMSHLEKDLFDGPGGLTKFLSDAEKGQLITV